MGDKQLLYFLPPSGRVMPNAVQLPTDYQHETWPSLRKKEGGYKIKMKKNNTSMSMSDVAQYW